MHRCNRLSATGGGEAAQMTLFVYREETAMHNSANPANATSVSGFRLGNSKRKMVVRTAITLSSTATFARTLIRLNFYHFSERQFIQGGAGDLIENFILPIDLSDDEPFGRSTFSRQH